MATSTEPGAQTRNCYIVENLANESGRGTSTATGVSIPKSNGSVINVATTSNDVSGGVPAFLLGVYVNTAIATEAVGIHDGTGGTELITLPIGLAEGTYIELPGIKFNTAIFVEAALATGNITVLWWPQ